MKNTQPKLTKNAISKIKSLILKKINDPKLETNKIPCNVELTEKEAKLYDTSQAIAVDYFLRLTVLGGGCAGFKYEFLLDSNIQEDDEIIKADEGVFLVVDKVSLSLIPGATIDFKNALIGSNFTISNPLADSACGCGASFNVKALE